jgi:hypothetical protein
MRYAVILALGFSLASTLSAFGADERDYNRENDRGRAQERRESAPRHQWVRGERLPAEFWRGHEIIDWRARHFREPPRGYHWVEVNGDFVLAALATGLILDVAVANPYTYPYAGSYPYPDAGAYPPVYGNGTPSPTGQYPAPPGASTPSWYYCNDPQGYYPYVASCNQNWQSVPATPPPPPGPPPRY